MGEQWMSFADRIVLKLYSFLFLIISLWIFAFHFQILSIPDMVTYFSHLPGIEKIPVDLLSAILLFLMSLSLFNFSRCSFKKKKIFRFQTDKGSVLLHLSAIENYILKSTEKFEQVHTSKISVFIKAKRLVVIAKVSLNTTGNLKNFTNIFQREIEKQLQNIIGFPISFLIRIHIVKIIRNDPQNNVSVQKYDQANLREEDSF